MRPLALIATLLLLGCAKPSAPRAEQTPSRQLPIPFDYPAQPADSEPAPVVESAPPLPSQPPVTLRPRALANPPVDPTPEAIPETQPEEVPESSPPTAVPAPTPAPIPVPEPTPVPPAVDLTPIRNAYAAELRSRIEAVKVYPAKAKRLKQQGTVGVTFTIDPTGALQSVALASESPHDSLNDAALEAVRAAVPFPAPPAELEAPLTLTIELRYSLQ